MAVYNDWTVEYKNGSTWTEIPNVQDLSCSVGRQTAVDQWPVSSASIRVWYPEGWASPLANLTIGTYIRFFAPGRSSTKPSWTGLVKDLVVEVGIPWNSGTSDGNADFLVIECEGFLGNVFRSNSGVVIFMGAGSFNGTVAQIVTVSRSSAVGIVCDNSTSATSSTVWFYGNDPAVDSTFTFIPSNLYPQLAALSNWKLLDGVRKSWVTGVGNADDPAMFFGRPSNEPTTATVGFSDTTNDANNRLYDNITFDGLADLYYTQAIINYAPNDYSGATSQATATSGSSPYRTFTTEGPPNALAAGTINYTNQATYLANAFTPPDIGVSVISATTNGQHTQNLDTLGVADLELGYLPLYVVPVTLRGQTFYCQIEGVQITADTNSARFTYYVTPTDTTAWFTLDSATFGVLDQNRLGIY